VTLSHKHASEVAAIAVVGLAGILQQIIKGFTKMLEEFCVLPVTSCSCERFFSKMVIVKSKLRSTTTQDRLEYLMLPYVEQDMVVHSICMDDVFRDLAKLRIDFS